MLNRQYHLCIPLFIYLFFPSDLLRLLPATLAPTHEAVLFAQILPPCRQVPLQQFLGAVVVRALLPSLHRREGNWKATQSCIVFSLIFLERK